MEPDRPTDGWRPPYPSYETLSRFIDERLGGNPLPPRIDRGFLDNHSGSTQAMLLAALKTTGLIGEAGEVLEPLKEASSGPDQRKAVLRRWAETYYARQIELAGQNATAQQLYESFQTPGYSGSTLRKAIVFYLALAEDVGLPKSPFFKPPRQTPTTTGSRKRKKPPEPSPVVQSAADEVHRPAGPGEHKTVSFGDAGSVSIHVNVRWLDLPDEVFRGLRAVVQSLEDLEREALKHSAPSESEDRDDA